MISAFLLWLSHVLYFSAKIYLTYPKKKKNKHCFLKSRSFCSCFCMCLPNLGDQIQNWEGRRFYLVSVPLEWSSSFLLKYPGRQWSSLRKYLTTVHLHEPVKAVCILDEDIGAHSWPFWISFQLRSCLCWESTPSSFWLRVRTGLQSLSLYWLAWTSLVKRKEDLFMFWSCFDSTWSLSFSPATGSKVAAFASVLSLSTASLSSQA